RGPVVHVHDAGHAVFRPPTVGRRAEPVVPPRPRPDVLRLVQGVRPGPVLRLLVADQGAVRRARRVGAVLPAGLPERLVAAEEGQVDPGVAGGLDVGPLAAGPVLVVADGQEGPVLADLGPAAVAIDV